MKTLKNQTLYQCSYCDKRLLSKRGARIHEHEYCTAENSPHQRAIAEKKKNCPHDHTETIYNYIPGEAVQEPSHEFCVDCGERFRLI